MDLAVNDSEEEFDEVFEDIFTVPTKDTAVPTLSEILIAAGFKVTKKQIFLIFIKYIIQF